MSFLDQIQNLSSSEDIYILKSSLGVEVDKPVNFDNIILRKKQQSYSHGCIDLPFEEIHFVNGVDFYTYKENYCHIGLLLFGLLLNEQNYLELKLSHPNSEVRQLFFYLESEYDQNSFLEVKQPVQFSSYHFFTSEIEKFALKDLKNTELACLSLGCSKGNVLDSESMFKHSDQVIVRLSLVSLIHFAELLLNIGNIHNKVNEVCLENPLFGIGGVQENSIEARFWLPNSFGFDVHDIDNITFE